MSHSTERDIAGTIIKANGLETLYRIGADCGEVFFEGHHFDGLTLVIAVTSEEEARTMLAAIEAPSRPDALSQALNEGDGVYRP